MAHIAKYKATSVGHMLAHYRRDASSLGRENIDPTRTKGNYTLGLDDVMREATEVARAAKALSRNHVAPTNSRPRGQAR